MFLGKNPLSMKVGGIGDHHMEINLLTLAFTGKDKNLEYAFIQRYSRHYLPQIRLALIIGIVFYALFGILDAIVADTLTHEFWFIRYGLVCPITFLIFLASFSKLLIKHIQMAIAIVIFIGGLGIIYMTAAGNLFISRTYFAGIILVFIFAYMFIRARFILASSTCTLLIVLHLILTIHAGKLPPIQMANNFFFLITANLMGMIACYIMEYYARQDFFMRELLRRWELSRPPSHPYPSK